MAVMRLPLFNQATLFECGAQGIEALHQGFTPAWLYSKADVFAIGCADGLPHKIDRQAHGLRTRRQQALSQGCYLVRIQDYRQ